MVSIEQALTWHKQGRTDEAEKAYLECSTVDPGNPQLYYLLSILYSDLGRLVDARVAIEKAVALSPQNSDYLLGKAELLARVGGEDEGVIALFDEVLRVEPNNYSVAARYAMYWVGREAFPEALPLFQKAIELKPELSVLWTNCGNVLRKLGETDAAIAHFEEACRLEADNAVAWNSLGEAFQAKGMAEEAQNSFRKAIEVDGNYTIARANLGIALHKAGKISESVECHSHCLKVDANNPSYKMNLASVYRDCCRHEEALELMCDAVEACPQDAKLVSKWLYSLNFINGLNPNEIIEAHARIVQCYATSNRRIARQKRGDGQIRLGFLSGDFCSHSVAFFLEPLLEKLDRSHFFVACYSEVADPDAVTARFEGLSDRWVSTCGKEASVVAESICDDEIDVLIDLSGHTAGGRLDIVALRPAPVVLNWLGYPSSMGWGAYDGRLVDVVTDPENGSVPPLSERSIYIEGGFLCYRGRGSAPSISATPAMKNGYVTFGSFNNAAKLNESVIEVWARILCSVENSKLLLKSWQYADEAFRDWLLGRFEFYGVSSDRILFKERVASYDDHLGCYGEMDIALDTFPYNGTTTTCEAMWMGVPVFALEGNRHASRVGASLLNSIGRSEWLASSVDGFVVKAVEWSGNLDRLNGERFALRRRIEQSSLGDAARFSKSFAEAIERSLDLSVESDPRIEDMVQQGLNLQIQGQLNEAKAIYLNVLNEVAPRADVLHYLGVLCYQLKEFEDSNVCLFEADKLNPDNGEILTHWGSTLQQLGKIDEALAVHARAVDLLPDNPMVRNNRANALLDSGRADEALEAFEACLKMSEGNAQTWCNYGLALKQVGRLMDSVNAGRRAIELDEGFSGAYSNLGVSLVGVGLADEAISVFKKSIAIDSRGMWAWSNLIYALHYSDRSSNDDIAKACNGFASSLSGVSVMPEVKWEHTCLRVGFVSADFREHAVARFLIPLLENYPDSVEIYLYGDLVREDDFTVRMKGLCGSWQNILGMNDEAVAQLIRRDEVDVLIDLAGHSSRNRLGVFARKPATVAATWLGFPGSTGLEQVDYRIVDETTLIEEEAGVFAEEPLYLERGFHCIEITGAPDVFCDDSILTRRFTFGSFNNLSKVGDVTLDAWCEVLRRLPRSRFVVKAYQLEDTGFGDVLKQRFEQRGVSAERLIFSPPVKSYDGHLAAYEGVDLCLDCFPYNGTTTTCEAMYMGVPVVTYLGDRACARVGASLMRQVGLEEFVADSVEGYIESAVAWAERREDLLELRQLLRGRLQASSLGDGRLFANEFFDKLLAAYKEKVS